MALPEVEAFMTMIDGFGAEDWRTVDSQVHGRLAPVRAMMLAPILSPVWVLERMLTVVALVTGQTRASVYPPGLLEAMQIGQRAEDAARSANASADAIRAAGMTAMALELTRRIGSAAGRLAPIAEAAAQPLLDLFPEPGSGSGSN